MASPPGSTTRRTRFARSARSSVWAGAPAPTSWSGFYFGGQSGFQWSEFDTGYPAFGTAFSVSHDSWVVGGVIGIQHQFGAFVVGIEGNLIVAYRDDYASADCPNTSYTCAARFDDVLTIGPRFGWAMGKWMPYITGGYGLGENVVQGSINPDEWYVHKPTLTKGFKPVIYSHLGSKEKKMVYAGASGGGSGKGTINTETPVEDRTKFCLNEDEVITLANWACVRPSGVGGLRRTNSTRKRTPPASTRYHANRAPSGSAARRQRQSTAKTRA